jgi:hypothetical protein
MKTQLSIALTLVNLVLLVWIAARIRNEPGKMTPGVLRARSLEIVDDQGKLRAQILVVPATTMPDGKKYAEGALFRLIDPNGRPGVKIGTSPDGSGMSLAGDSERREWNGIQLLANQDGTSVKLTNKNGAVQTLTP